MMPSFANETITVVTPGTRTVHGSTVDDWAAATRRDIDYCVVDSASTTELSERGRSTTQDACNVQLPVGAVPPTPQDKVILPGRGEYRVQGEVQPITSPSGALDGSQFYAERSTNRA